MAVNESSALLLTSIKLPRDGVLHFAQFVCSQDDPFPALEAARARVAMIKSDSTARPDPIGSLLARIHSSKGVHHLWIFAVTPREESALLAEFSGFRQDHLLSKSLVIPQGNNY